MRPRWVAPVGGAIGGGGIALNIALGGSWWQWVSSIACLVNAIVWPYIKES